MFFVSQISVNLEISPYSKPYINLVFDL